MTNSELREILDNQKVIMEALEVLIFARAKITGNGLSEEEGRALLKLANAQGRTRATIELIK